MNPSKSHCCAFRAMLKNACARGFTPRWVVYEGDALLTRLKSNRLVNPDGKGKYEAKTAIICDVIRNYLSHPLYSP